MKQHRMHFLVVALLASMLLPTNLQPWSLRSTFECSGKTALVIGGFYLERRYRNPQASLYPYIAIWMLGYWFTQD